MKLTILLLLCFATCAAAGKNWAMLFTGATGWSNYAAPASICHAYQVLHKAGIPDERIVVLMDNSPVHYYKNPFPGKLFNNYNHTDVYRGTPMDYTKVTADLVLAVLQGDKAAVRKITGKKGKVIDSGPDDNVFVASVGHGAPGILNFPDRQMTAKELNAALRSMHDNKKFAKLVFYLESCESGSMFLNDLSKELSIYAITASTATHDAYMRYCSDPKFPDVCLGGQFTTGWTENTERIDINTFTLMNQSEAIKKVVNDSRPQMYGDYSFLDLPLQDFFSSSHSRSRPLSSGQAPSTQKNQVRDHSQGISFSNMHLHLLQRQVKAKPTDAGLRSELARLQAMMADVDRFFHLTATHVYPGNSARVARITESSGESIRNWDCYKSAVDTVNTSCRSLLYHPKLEGYFLSKFSTLVNLCNRERGSVVSEAVLAASTHIELCY